MTDLAMKAEWTLAELQDLFPAMPRTASSVFRCVAPASSEGRYFRESGGRTQSASVRVRADPALTFQLRFEHEWPSSIPSFALTALHEALLRGMAEGSFAAFTEPIWGCSIACTEIGHAGGPATSTGISSAASMAVQNLLTSGRWLADGPPGKEPA